MVRGFVGGRMGGIEILSEAEILVRLDLVDQVMGHLPPLAR